MLSKFEKISNCLRFSEFSRFANNHRAQSSFERLNVLDSFDSFNFEFKIRITRIRVIEFSLIPIDLRLSLSLPLYSFVERFLHNELEKIRKRRRGERNLENRVALTSGVTCACGGKSRSGDKTGKSPAENAFVTSPSAMTFKTPRAWISPAKYFFPNFEIHLRRFIPSPLLFPFFLFSLFSIKTSKIFLDTRLSLYSSKNSRNSNEADRRTDRKRERKRQPVLAQRGNVPLDFRDRIRHDISTEPLRFSLFLSGRLY